MLDVSRQLVLLLLCCCAAVLLLQPLRCHQSRKCPVRSFRMLRTPGHTCRWQASVWAT
jgi:hypothetical protein